ncbi:hypothetical protein C8J56DRAFT_902302 [Mycena floridula]|nr:hypothetical protein C8J56DRAFT_902302 [Mycena floridula]
MSIASGMPSNSVSSPKYIGLGVAEAIIQSFEVPHSTKCNPEKHQHYQANWEDQWFKKISFRLLDPDDMLCPAFLVAALENIKHHDMVPECRKLKLNRVQTWRNIIAIEQPNFIHRTCWNPLEHRVTVQGAGGIQGDKRPGRAEHARATFSGIAREKQSTSLYSRLLDKFSY